MATARRKPPEPPGEPPAASELDDALRTYRVTREALSAAADAHDEAARRVVALLRRSGLEGMTL